MGHTKVNGICENLCMVEVIPKENVVRLSKHIVTQSATQSLSGLVTFDYPEGFDMDNTYVLSTRIKYEDGYYDTKYVTAYDNNTKFSDTVSVRNYSDGIRLFGRLPQLEIGTTVKLELVIMKMELAEYVKGEDYILGDVNGNGQITNDDKTLVQSFLQGSVSLTDKQFKAADANEDGVVDSSDLLIIQRWIG